jgi:hypothetical protein
MTAVLLGEAAAIMSREKPERGAERGHAGMAYGYGITYFGKIPCVMEATLVSAAPRRDDDAATTENTLVANPRVPVTDGTTATINWRKQFPNIELRLT